MNLFWILNSSVNTTAATQLVQQNRPHENCLNDILNRNSGCRSTHWALSRFARHDICQRLQNHWSEALVYRFFRRIAFISMATPLFAAHTYVLSFDICWALVLFSAVSAHQSLVEKVVKGSERVLIFDYTTVWEVVGAKKAVGAESWTPCDSDRWLRAWLMPVLQQHCSHRWAATFAQSMKCMAEHHWRTTRIREDSLSEGKSAFRGIDSIQIIWTTERSALLIYWNCSNRCSIAIIL